MLINTPKTNASIELSVGEVEHLENALNIITCIIDKMEKESYKILKESNWNINLKDLNTTQDVLYFLSNYYDITIQN